jgi:type II secretory pathway component PulK
MKRFFPSFHNNRGVALLIVLLVTALLIALIFEFAYATRVSLRAAVNFRDSQRAYFLARSAVNVFAKSKDLQDSIPHGEWGVVPIVSEGDTELRIRWEDENGKIDINMTNSSLLDIWMGELFSQQGVDQSLLERLRGLKKERGNTIPLITDLHLIMSDEEFNKIQSYLTVYSTKQINVNTASEVVLKSVLRDKTPSAETVLTNRPLLGLSDDINNSNFTITNSVFKVYAYATVGGYTRQIEAVVNRGSTTPRYWRVM